MNLNKLRNGKLGIIIPCFNESRNIEALIKEISLIASSNKIEAYPIVIDDGSYDNTYNVALEILKDEFERGFTIQRFIRNFGKEAAILAGLRQSKKIGCSCTALIDADFQDNPDTLVEMYSKWQKGDQLISCIRGKRYKVDSFFKRSTSYLFYLVFSRSSNFKYKKGIGDFRLMDKSVIDYLLMMPERVRFFKGLIQWVGEENSYVYSERNNRRAGKSKWNFWKLWNYALDGIFNYSTSPIRIWTYVGLISIIIGLGYLFISLFLTYLGIFSIQPGYFSVITLILLFGGLNMMGIGLLGEYIGRIFTEIKQRPNYIIRDNIVWSQSKESKLNSHNKNSS